MKTKTLETQLGRFILKNYRIPRIYHYRNYDRLLLNKSNGKPVMSKLHSVDEFNKWFNINHKRKIWNKVTARVSSGNTKFNHKK